MVVIRFIEADDYHRGYLDLINTFTRHPTAITFEQFKHHLTLSLNQNAFILVAETEEGQIVGTAKVLVEYKLHNNLAKMAHIEDVVVHKDYRKQEIGTKLVAKALEYTQDCYKIVLSCKPELVPFYTRHNFNQCSTTLTLYNFASSSVIPSK